MIELFWCWMWGWLGEITELRKVYSAIRDGQATWAEYTRKPEAEPDDD